MNLAALVALAWVVSREARGSLPVLITAACVLFAWRAPRFLASPWTAHVPVLPSITFIVLCAAVVSGRVAAAAADDDRRQFLAQTHVGFAPMVAGLSAAVLAGLVIARREDDRPIGPILIISAGGLDRTVGAADRRGGVARGRQPGRALAVLRDGRRARPQSSRRAVQLELRAHRDPAARLRAGLGRALRDAGSLVGQSPAPSRRWCCSRRSPAGTSKPGADSKARWRSRRSRHRASASGR